MTARMPACDSVDLRIPLIVGACGHRDIPHRDQPALCQIVYDRLRSLKVAHAGMPLVVLSALAEGADRIVANAALRLRDQHPNDVRLIVPLPMRPDIYLQDFRQPAAQPPQDASTDGDNALAKGAKSAGHTIGRGFKKLFGRGQDQNKKKP